VVTNVSEKDAVFISVLPQDIEKISESMKEKDYSVDLGVDERIIIKLILNRMRGCGLDLSSSGE
jgi:hypothetical protein